MSDGAERCPTCGAALAEKVSDAADIPGVTQVDPVLGMRRQVARPNRLVGWLADVDIEPTPTIAPALGRPGATGGAQGVEAAGPASVAPPSEEVRREMARLELEALRAQLESRAAEARLAGAGTADATPADVEQGAETDDASAH